MEANLSVRVGGNVSSSGSNQVYFGASYHHEIPDAKLNGHRSIRLPGNVNFSFKGLEGASLLILLDEDGICASGGSACNTGEERISYVIKALGVPEEYAPGTIRITLCGDTTRADVDAALVSLKRNIAVLRG